MCCWDGTSVSVADRCRVPRESGYDISCSGCSLVLRSTVMSAGRILVLLRVLEWRTPTDQILNTVKQCSNRQCSAVLQESSQSPVVTASSGQCGKPMAGSRLSGVEAFGSSDSVVRPTIRPVSFGSTGTLSGRILYSVAANR